MSNMFRCLSCHEMVFVDAGACRFCGSAFEVTAARSAAAQQDRITQIVAGANQMKLGVFVAPFLVIIDVVMLFLPFLPLKIWFMVQIIPPAALLSQWIWLRKTRSIETVDPDLAGARAAMKRALYVWLAVFVVQLILVAVFLTRFDLL